MLFLKAKFALKASLIEENNPQINLKFRGSINIVQEHQVSFESYAITFQTVRPNTLSLFSVTETAYA